MPISPLWCNVYLHRLDWELVRQRWAVVRYADDFVVCCPGPQQAAAGLEFIVQVLEGIRLRVEPSKTHITRFEDGFEFLGVGFDRDSYTFLWQGKAIDVVGPVPAWLWGYMPEDYT
jgi:retron-type reverse transcriptase